MTLKTYTANNSKGRIFYVIPDIHKPDWKIRKQYQKIKSFSYLEYLRNNLKMKHKPVGGIKVIYQHCMILNELGYECHPLKLGEYEGNFYDYDLDFKTIKETGYDLENSILVIPEHIANISQRFSCKSKIIFAQSFRTYHVNIFNSETSKNNYRDLGCDSIITVSQFIYEKLKPADAKITHIINNYVDHDRFKQNDQSLVSNRILVLTRKNKDDLTKLLELLKNIKLDLILADQLKEKELIEEYQKADIFLTLGYPEGFGLTPLEAMACGCVVIGFTGGGGDEYMIHNQTALIAKDGDIRTLAKHVVTILDDEMLKEKIRGGGIDISKKYCKQNTKNQLETFYRSQYLERK